ncbi:MAG: hypothetical protein JWO06_1448 [Bacteroidota bacterium]|nr:hypothetical protein [Bacteroidota bacterium]
MLISGCGQSNSSKLKTIVLPYPLLQISDSRTDPFRLTGLIDSLDTIVKEPSSFWADIANDSAFSKYHRAVCAQALLRRHVHKNMDLKTMAVVIGKVNWLRDKDISSRMTFNAGIWSIGEALMRNDNSSVFVFHIFPELADTLAFKNMPDRRIKFYLVTTGQISSEDFAKFLLHQYSDSLINKAKILAMH